MRNLLPQLAALTCLLGGSSGVALAAPVATSTSLTVSAGGATVTTIAVKTPVTLKATVTAASGASAASGQVLFCDNAVANCAISPLAIAQTVAGSATATYTFLPGPSTHSYSARFLGNASFAGSVSSAQALNVTGSIATRTALTSSFASSLYTLTAQVSAQQAVDLSAAVTFTDTASGAVLGSKAANVTLLSTSIANKAQPFTGDNGACTIAAGDFNRDGVPDIAAGVGCAAPDGSNSANALEILLGSGDGTFAAAAAVSGFANTNVLALATGDFNNDGILDLIASTATSITASGGNFRYTYALQFVAGNGDGTFAAPVQVNSSCNNSHLVTGDFNNDGNQDFAADCYSSSTVSAPVQIYLGSGNGRFTTTGGDASAGSSKLVQALSSGDVNNDGIADLVIGSISGDYTVLVLLGKGDGTFQSGSTYPVTNGLLTALADVNGDGKADMVTLSYVSNSPASSLLSTQLGNNDGTFAAAVSTTVPVASGSGGVTLLAADFDGDHRSDAAVVTYNAVRLLHGLSNGTFGSLASLALPVLSAPDNFPAALADLNGDGVPDLFASSSDGTTGLALLTSQTSGSSVQITTAPPTGSGNHPVVAAYVGNSYTVTSTSPAVSLTAAPAATSLVLTAAPGQATAGTQVTLTASLAPYNAGTLTTDGESVSFMSANSMLLGTASLRTGVATLNLTTLQAGANSIVANYAGDTNFLATASSAITVTVTAPSAPMLSAASLSFAAQAIATASAAQAVSLTNRSTGPLAIASIVASGDFSQTSGCGTTLPAGASCTITVVFTPTATGARSGTLTITDNATTPTQTVALTGTGAAAVGLASVPTSLTVTRGSNGQASLQIQAANGYAGVISLSCVVSYQGMGTPSSAPACSVNPTTVTLASAGSAAATLTVSTTAAAALLQPLSWGRDIGLAGLCVLAGFGRARRMRGALLLAFFTFTVLGVGGCGGSGAATSSSAGTAGSGTTTGSYIVTVTAAAGSTNTSVTVPLTVQ